MAEKEGQDLNTKLNDLISSLQQEDILDSFFNQLRGLQDDEFDPQLVTGVITTYLDEAIIKIAELAIQLGTEHAVNYPKVKDLADEMMKSTLSIGGSRLGDVCAKLCEACEAEEKETCTALFKGLESEFLTLEDSLNKIAQLEEEIYYKNKKGQTEQ